jgi:hypothetical protein
MYPQALAKQFPMDERPGDDSGFESLLDKAVGELWNKKKENSLERINRCEEELDKLEKEVDSLIPDSQDKN